MKDFFANKPWKAWKTRKCAFLYSLILGTALIIFGAVATIMGIDPSGFLDVSLRFVEWIVTTGAAIVVVKAVKNKDNSEE